MAIIIPKTQYIGINLSRTSNESMPLGFLTPGGTDAAAKKRRSTVDNWIGKGSSPPTYVHKRDTDYAKWEADNPTAEYIRTHNEGDESEYKMYRIPTQEGKNWKCLDNVPNEPRFGFRITQAISRGGSWNGNNKVVRIEDPRGFELEISVDNLVKMMSMTIFINGVCQEKCVWGRAGANNILLPVNSAPYIEAVKATDYVNKKNVSLRDVQIGDTVEFKATTQRPSATGEYMGLYRVYGVRGTEERMDASTIRSSYYRQNPLDYTMIKESKRYILRITDKQGNIKYEGHSSAKVHQIISKVDTPLEKFDIDPELYSDANYGRETVAFAILPKPVKINDMMDHISFQPVANDIALPLLKKRESGKLFAWAKDPKDGAMMQFYRPYMGYQHGQRKAIDLADRQKIFEGWVTHIDYTNNTWELLNRRGKDGAGPWTLLKDEITGQRAALLVEEYDWHQLVVTINNQEYKLPITKDGY